MRPLLLCSLTLASLILSAKPESLEPIDLQLTALEDSVDYFVYRYTATNPATSTQGMASVRLDVSASPGPALPSLPATGRFLDGPAVTSRVPIAPHAQIGPISPPGWQAALDRRTPLLDWYGVNGGIFDHDSIAPGDSLPGLGIRSTFFPAIRRAGGVPTWQSCCQAPWGTEEENPTRAHRDPEYFAATSYALAPGYRPEEVTVALLQMQLDQICSEPLWLPDTELCSRWGDLLQSVSDMHRKGESDLAAEELGGLLQRLTAADARMEPEAYWLLYRNLQQAWRNIAADAR